ncbi:MAG: hypothetical protein HQM07_03900 [Zetaproteobacteria bacterium]|nr:hypothetical protein [Zetaproteobacteria bacterium]
MRQKILRQRQFQHDSEQNKIHFQPTVSPQKSKPARRIKQLLLQPKRLLIIGEHGRANRPFIFHPLITLIFLLMLITLSFALGHRLFPEKNDHFIAKISYLQNERDQLLKDKATIHAVDLMKSEKIQALEDALKREKMNNILLTERINTFENLLSARKEKGVSLVQASLISQEKGILNYEFALAKGADKSRIFTGSIQIDILDHHHERKTLLFDGDSNLPFTTTSHIFLRGSIPLNAIQEDDIKQAEIIIFDNRNHELLRKKVLLKKI